MSDTPIPRRLRVTERTRHRRLREQGSVERADLDAILAAGFVCHLGVVVDGSPMVVPTVYGADDEQLYLHGSVVSRSLVAAPHGPVCVTVTHVDGVVLARSLFEHSVNYRSVMVFGIPRIIADPVEKLAALRCLSEQAAPGQWDYARRPNAKELAATVLLALSLDQASVKIRTGGPADGDLPDAALDVWAGVVPVHTVFGTPVPDDSLRDGIRVPDHVAARATLAH